MNTVLDTEPTNAEGTVTLTLEPDILTLGNYLAKRCGWTLDNFIEYLIAKEASKGKCPSAESLTISVEG